MTTQAGLEQMVERVNGRAINNADAFLRMLSAIRRLPEARR